MRKANKPVLFVIVIMMAVLLSGCMQMSIDIIWKEDNSGTLSMTIGIDKSVLSMMGTTEEDLQKQLKESMLEEDDYTVRNFSNEKYTGITATTTIADMTTETNDTTQQISFNYTDKSGNKIYTVSGNFNGAEALGGNSSFEDSGLSMTDIEMKMSITMPGEIISHNATNQEGNKLTWDMTETSTTEIQATSEIGSGGGMLLWILIGLGVLVVVTLFIFLRRNKSNSDSSVMPLVLDQGKQEQ